MEKTVTLKYKRSRSLPVIDSTVRIYWLSYKPWDISGGNLTLDPNAERQSTKTIEILNNASILIQRERMIFHWSKKKIKITTMVYIIVVLISLEIVQLLARGVNQPACT